MSSKLLEERQAEMHERMLQERANRKKDQFALEPKRVSIAWDTAPKPQAESEPLEKTRVELAIEKQEDGDRMRLVTECLPRQAKLDCLISDELKVQVNLISAAFC